MLSMGGEWDAPDSLGHCPVVPAQSIPPSPGVLAVLPCWMAVIKGEMVW